MDALEQLRDENKRLERLLKAEHAETRRLKYENADLRRKLEMQAIDTQAMVMGTVEIYRHHISRLQKQRDEATQQAERLSTVIGNSIDLAYEAANRAKSYAERDLAKVEAILGSQDTPITALVISEIARNYALTFLEMHSVIDHEITLRTGKTELDPLNNPELCIHKILNLWTVQHCWHFASYLWLNALRYADVKSVLAHELIIQCRSHQIGKLVQTLQRLGLDWLRDNLDDCPTRLDVIAKGLEWVQKCKDSGTPMRTFAELHPDEISDRTLRTYSKWYDALMEIGQPSKIADILPTRDE